MIFVDGTNVDQRCRQAFHRNDIDYSRFFAMLAGDRDLLEVVYCTAPYVRHARNDPVYAEQQGRLNRIRRLPNVVIREGRHEREDVECRRAEGGCDTYT